MTDATGDVPTADAEGEAEEQPFENRATRRAKGKSTAKHTGDTGTHVHGRSGTTPSPRQYGNRRSG
ncbi:hypothetical protein [Actinoplanes sp. L3-i22]|uniref:hypothetical protein n=1 Tax=Actinoplanes sp. L3-i22 TaxID=2836373 RepID=UPI001C74E939|nr:hypothetical protein [Actinoplanes sp. L3-i22]BCY12910.1 hypothetical protein L3i22_079980 [Actinoplanes sp. L3-i22]